MKIALIGFLVFSGWSAGSTYVYVCVLKGLCDDPIETPLVQSLPDEERHLDGLVKEVEMPTDLTIYFAFDESYFSPDSNLDAYIAQSSNYLAQHTSAQLIMVGHTDARGSVAYNQRLGQERAESIRQYAEKKGLSRNQIAISSKGELDLADSAKTTIGHAHNRRVALTIKQ